MFSGGRASIKLKLVFICTFVVLLDNEFIYYPMRYHAGAWERDDGAVTNKRCESPRSLRFNNLLSQPRVAN
jgi:hypothetical protein